MTRGPAASVSAGAGQAAEARSRGRVYALLSVVFRREPSKKLLEELGRPDLQAALSKQGLKLPPIRPDDKGLIADLGEEYSRLFLVPGPERVSPFESVHAKSGEGDLMGKEAVDAGRFLEEIGLKLDDSGLLPDHVAVELEVMRKLADAETEALEKGETRRAAEFREAQRLFLERHLALWISAFARGVGRSARRPFYREAAIFTASFVAADLEGLRAGKTGPA